MIASLQFLLLVLAFLSFVLAARVNLTALGLALWVLSLMGDNLVWRIPEKLEPRVIIER